MFEVIKVRMHILTELQISEGVLRVMDLQLPFKECVFGSWKALRAPSVFFFLPLLYH